MKTFRFTVIPVFLATIWISLSEFIRNEFLLKSYWVDHYAAMGLEFPSEPLNGAVWGLWSLFFAIVLFVLRKRFSFTETLQLGWLAGFVLMWVVTGNLGVLPFGILIYAVPLSILEVAVAVWIIQRFTD